MALPTEADVNGPAHDDVERYLQSATLTGPDRVRLFRLVWDTCISAFAGRQSLYEYYFFGDPVRMAAALVPQATTAPPIGTACRHFWRPARPRWGEGTGPAAAASRRAEPPAATAG